MNIRIETFELTTAEYRRMKKLDSEKFELHDEKYFQGIQKFVRFRWFFELCEFQLKEFSWKAIPEILKGPKNLFDLDELVPL